MVLTRFQTDGSCRNWGSALWEEEHVEHFLVLLTGSGFILSEVLAFLWSLHVPQVVRRSSGLLNVPQTFPRRSRHTEAAPPLFFMPCFPPQLHPLCPVSPDMVSPQASIMSSFPYRQPSDSDLRPDPRRYASGAERDFYGPPQEPPPSSQENVMGLLSSCGLEPEDLSVLAKLPEDILTLESLPQILKQIKGQKAPPPLQSYPPRSLPDPALGTVKPLPARPPSPLAFSSAHRPSTSSASRDWEQLRRQPVQYPLHLIQSNAGPGRRSPPSSSSSRRAVDLDLRPRPPSYGRDGSSFSASLDRPRPSRPSDYRAAPPPDERRRDSRSSYGSRSSERTLERASDRARDTGTMPSKKQALDFHGASPTTFPYTCSLCDITVLSEKVWTQHVNTTGHADGQLNLLQRFPRWDCRLESARRDDNQSDQRKDGPKPSLPTPRPNRDKPLSKKQQQKALDKGKVVCAKFAPQSVDEASLRKLIEPFGKIGKILMFPSLAFVEMDSSDQAKDLVNFYSSSDPAARKAKVEFNISNAFSFLQSSQVVSFTPAPSGEDGRSDLLSIAKRFGEPLYTLFLPSKAFVEMKLPGEAQKMVDYYTSNVLRLNGDTIQVAFSSEYHTLMRVPSVQKYEEEPVKAKESTRTRRSRSRDRSRSERRKRSSSRDRKRRETRSRSRDKSRTKSSREKRSKSRERPSTMSPNQNRSEEKPKEPKKSGSELVSAEEHQRKEGVSTNTEAAKEEKKDEEQMGDGDQSAADESDIEGMEVIAEDGENVEDLDSQEENGDRVDQPEEGEKKTPEAGEGKLENLEAEEEKPELQEEKVEEMMEKEEEKVVEMEDKEKVEVTEKFSTEEQKPAADEETTGMDHEEEAEFPVDLESCITLDEVQSDDEGESPPADGHAEGVLKESSRVLFFRSMPLQYTDLEFITLMRSFGTVVRYILIQNRQQAFVEMFTEAEALKAAEELRSKPAYINGTRLAGTLSETFPGPEGWSVPDEEDSGRKTRSRTTERSEITTRTQKETEAAEQEATRTGPDPETSGKPAEARTRSGRAPEKKSPPRTSGRKTRTRKNLEKETSPRCTRTRTSASRTTPEKRTAPPESDAVPAKATKTEAEPEPTEMTPEPEPTERTPEPEPIQTEPEPTERTPEPERNEERKPEGNNPEPAEQEAAPAEGATEPQRPSKPVGAEFVRPVVGYFCNLCQLIFADEDEAKLQHCATPAHYAKYQEKTGNDPWSS